MACLMDPTPTHAFKTVVKITRSGCMPSVCMFSKHSRAAMLSPFWKYLEIIDPHCTKLLFEKQLEANCIAYKEQGEHNKRNTKTNLVTCILVSISYNFHFDLRLLWFRLICEINYWITLVSRKRRKQLLPFLWLIFWLICWKVVVLNSLDKLRSTIVLLSQRRTKDHLLT